jgi:hypothetical protein
MTGRQIDIGDIVLFTQPGAGRNLPGLCFGEVEGLTKASVRVFYLDKQFRRKQQEIFVDDTSRSPRYTKYNGEKVYHKIGTGQFHDQAPEAVKIYEDRFYIVRKI